VGKLREEMDVLRVEVKHLEFVNKDLEEKVDEERGRKEVLAEENQKL
jgi:hypothetical protein